MAVPNTAATYIMPFFSKVNQETMTTWTLIATAPTILPAPVPMILAVRARLRSKTLSTDTGSRTSMPTYIRMWFLAMREAAHPSIPNPKA